MVLGRSIRVVSDDEIAAGALCIRQAVAPRQKKGLAVSESARNKPSTRNAMQSVPEPHALVRHSIKQSPSCEKIPMSVSPKGLPRDRGAGIRRLAADPMECRLAMRSGCEALPLCISVVDCETPRTATRFRLARRVPGRQDAFVV